MHYLSSSIFINSFYIFFLFILNLFSQYAIILMCSAPPVYPIQVFLHSIFPCAWGLTAVKRKYVYTLEKSTP